jgi:hypothetical protein
MKLIPLILCAAALAATPVASQAAVHGEGFRGGLGAGLSVGLGVGLLMGPRDDDRHHNHRDDNNRRGDDRRDNAPAPPPGPNPGNIYRSGPVPMPGNLYRRDAGAYDRRDVAVGGGGVRDERINRAIAIGQVHGHVLNAWPQGGSLFIVRVATPRGRVDMIIDVDTGRVVGER